MRGIKLKDAIVNRDFKAGLEAEGLLVAPAGDNVIRLLPPLIIQDAHIAEALSIFETVAQSYV